MANTPDTIAACATAPGRGAIGIIRLSGPAVPGIAAELIGSLPEPKLARLSRFRAADGSTLDEGIALYFAAPASFTGEHVLEIQGHGGPVVIDMLLHRLVGLGCRLARPGEFSERAFLNGKVDVAQAEAVADLINAGSSAAARAAVRTMQGEFSARIAELERSIRGLRTYVEAAIDFPDEEIDFLSDAAVGSRITQVFAAFDSIVLTAQQGALLREGLNVVIAGKPNAGKSSLLNRLAGEDVAIVADLPGTTRDLLRQQVQLDGLPLNLVDTAGLRTAADPVEAEGVRRAKNEISRADHLLYIVDASAGEREASILGELAQFPQSVPVTMVFNKIDVVGMAPRIQTAEIPRVFLSAKTGLGVDLLRNHLKEAAGYRDLEAGALTARRRHLDALARSKKHVENAARTLSSTRAFELFAEDLRLAQRALGEITGEYTNDDLLGEIFGSFCIGK